MYAITSDNTWNNNKLSVLTSSFKCPAGVCLEFYHLLRWHQTWRGQLLSSSWFKNFTKPVMTHSLMSSSCHNLCNFPWKYLTILTKLHRCQINVIQHVRKWNLTVLFSELLCRLQIQLRAFHFGHRVGFRTLKTDTVSKMKCTELYYYARIDPDMFLSRESSPRIANVCSSVHLA